MKNFSSLGLLVTLTLTFGGCAGSRPSEMTDTMQTGKFEVAPTILDPQKDDDESGDSKFLRPTDNALPFAKPSLALPE
jgi:hypothetical protein